MKNNRLTTLILILMGMFGLALLFYPTIADWNNSRHASHLIAGYVDQVADMTGEDYTGMLEEAHAYNEKMRSLGIYVLTPELMEEYESVLDVTGTGILGYLSIPKLDVSLPIYHGTSEGVLQIAVGHLEWSDLPVGGAGTHCVISGHRGLPSAKLLSDLPEMENGDHFCIRVLNEVLTYEVDQILTVLPEEVDSLRRTPGKDYCTLITCTPYGINTHRLLVRGHRVATEEADQIVTTVTAEAVRLEALVVAPFIAAPILFLLLLLVLFSGKKRDEE